MATALVIASLGPSTLAAETCANPGGSGTVSSSGVVNDYWAGSGSSSSGSTSITLGARTSGGAGNTISAGDMILIIQMQDANINGNNTSAYGSGGATGSGSTAINSAGLYEYVVATNTVGSGGGALTFAPALTNSYRTRSYTAGSNGQSTWQAIRVPQYLSASANGVTAIPWNGATGGVVALDVQNAFTLSGTTAINAAGLGFRGGAGRSLAGGSGASTDYVTLSSNNANGSKAEGIAGTPRYVNASTGAAAPGVTNTGTEGLPNGSYARGAPGDAGGGGTDGNPANNDQNSGGGGGSNYGAGGQGGNSWSSNLSVGGKGGAAYNASVSFGRVFLGGGGGAGTTNDATGDSSTYTNPPGIGCSTGAGACSSGARGGGIVLIRAGSISGSGLIDARGGHGYNVVNDGAGGGGAGGSVVLQTYSGGSATINVSGGNGGNAWRGTTGSFNNHGPGGGGGGGFVAYSPSSGLSVSATVTGGQSGRTSDGTVYGASSGNGGTSTYNAPSAPGVLGGAFCLPSLIFMKTVNVLSDPVNGSSNPKSIPGAEVLYTLTLTNTGPGTADSNTTVITDPIPANTSLFISDLGVAGSGPIGFSNGSPTSSLAWTYTSLPSTTDNLDFSNNNGSTWVYTPTPDVNGYDSAVTNIRLKPGGKFAGNSGSGNPSASFSFKVKIK